MKDRTDLKQQFLAAGEVCATMICKLVFNFRYLRLEFQQR